MADKVILPDPEDLVRRAIRNHRPPKKMARWAAIMELFAVGSTYARAICAKYGCDPDEEVKAWPR